MSEPLTTPAWLRAERSEPLRRILRKLPDSILETLIRGLDDAETLVPGRLYADGRGGCAVGVILRRLFFSESGRGDNILLRRRRRTLKQINPRMARRFPHLVTLEGVFDRTFELARDAYPSHSEQEISLMISRWMAAEAATELGFRDFRLLGFDPKASAEQPAGGENPQATVPALA